MVTPLAESHSPPPADARTTALEIARRLAKAGHEALLNGGCVRDRLLGKPPKDYDIATSARPEEVQGLFPHTVAVGAQFGVIVVVMHGVNVEVATFRSDEAYVDGRRPTGVRWSSPREDAERRDFTVNGLFERPETGEILDFVGGLADLEKKVIRAIGDPHARFREDKLRLLRAARFAAQLGFTIEGATLEAMRAHAPDIGLVAKERVLVELTKTITAKGRVDGLRILHATGLLREVLPEVAALDGVAQPPEYHPEGDCWVHQLLVMQHLPDAPSDELAWGALLHDVGKPPTFRVAERIRFDGHAAVGAEMARAILERLKAPNRLRQHVEELVADHQRFAEVTRMKASTLKRFLRNERIGMHLDLHRADCLASHGKLDHHEFCVRALADMAAQGAEEALRPKPLLRGADLLALGYRPGPAFKAALTALEDAQLEGRASTREAAIALVEGILGKP